MLLCIVYNLRVNCRKNAFHCQILNRSCLTQILMSVRMMNVTPVPCVPTLKGPMCAAVSEDIKEMGGLAEVEMLFRNSQ